jgi:hypothetical protein
MKKKYTVLRTISGLYRLVGALIPVAGVILAVLAMLNSRRPDIGSALAVAISGFVTGAGFYGFGELIMVFLDIEENTRRLSARPKPNGTSGETAQRTKAKQEF